MSAAQKNAYGVVASNMKNLGSTRAMAENEDDIFKGLKNIQAKGSVQGQKERRNLEGYEMATKEMTDEQKTELETLQYQAQHGPNIVKKAVNEFLENGKLSYRTNNQMKSFTHTPGGRSILQSALRGISLPDVSEKQADTINKMTVESGLVEEGQDFIEAGQSVTMDIGYDKESGELSCSNLSADKMVRVDEGIQ
ncbi:MAG: hypothetical protein GY755_10560, partial [Chloroflexi bacterium]|nr:hypothetical protein [Chloroflexota bacterium]